VKLKRNIKNIGALFLVLVFVLQAVPKILLHNTFAKHHHDNITSKKENKNATSFELKSNCDCDDLYTETLFEENIVFSSITKHILTSQNSIFVKNNIINSFGNIDLRGPPNA
jgi:hypothetical protein